MRVWLVCSVLMVLAGCQLALPGKDRGAEVGASPITGGTIEVTSLDAGAPKTEAEEQPTQPAATQPAAKAGSETAGPAAAGMVAKPVPAAAVKTAAHLACEKRKGVWSSTGAGKAAFCQTPTADGGKFCKTSSDCKGYCLAKSNTCAPVTPMLGCQDILNDVGRMLTQCIN